MSRARSSLWLIPVACLLAGLLLSFGTVAVDRLADYDLIPRSLTGGPESALGILTTIAASMVSLLGLVLTITMVVVQLAMGQFSPRIVQTFLRDRPSQFAIGLFVSTFAHAMVSMREVSSDPEQVPGLAVVVSYVLVLATIVMLVVYVTHIGRSLRVSALIELVGDDTRQLLDRYYGERLMPERDDPVVIEVSDSGVVVEVDCERLVELAAAADCVFHVVPALGGFVPAGAALIRIEGDPAGVDRAATAGAVTFALERTLDQDVAYGFRMLVDMAERALSESPFLDPTSAVQAIDRLHDGLRQLAVRKFPDGRFRDASGTVRMTMPVMSWEAYVHLAFDEIRLVGIESPQVTRRLVAVLEDLLDVAPPDRRPVLQEQLELIFEASNATDRDERDRKWALTPDHLGIGPRAGRPPGGGAAEDHDDDGDGDGDRSRPSASTAGS